jgi:Golgi phosphoprotein 3 (GPP34)
MLPEDLMLLFIDEKTGRVRMDTASIHTALAGAVLLELVDSGRVAFEADGVKLAVVDPTPLENEFLQESLDRLDRPMDPTRAVKRLRTHVRENVMAQLVDKGVLTVEQTRMFGIFPSRHYMLQDPKVISDIRDAIEKAAWRRGAPDKRIRALMSLTYAVGALHGMFDDSRGQIYARAKSIAADDWVADAVKEATDSVSKATRWKIVASEMAAASGGGSN